MTEAAVSAPTPVPAPARSNGAHDPAVWAAVRADYEAGRPIGWILDRHGVGRSTLHQRRAAEGWAAPVRARRPDDDDRDDAEDDADDLDPDAPALSAAQMMDQAWRRAGRALQTGRSAAAQRYLRMHAMLEAAEHARARREAEAAEAARRAPAERNLTAHRRAMDDLHLAMDRFETLGRYGRQLASVEAAAGPDGPDSQKNPPGLMDLDTVLNGLGLAGTRPEDLLADLPAPDRPPPNRAERRRLKQRLRKKGAAPP